MHKKYHKKFKILDILAVTTQAREGIETLVTIAYAVVNSVTTQAREGIETCWPHLIFALVFVTTQKKCLSPAKKYKLYKSSINKSIHFAQRRLSNSTRVQVQRVTAQLNLSRE